MRSGLVSMIHSNANVLNARPARQQLRACTTSVFGQKLKELLRNVYFLGRRLKDTVVTNLRHMDMSYGSNKVIRAMRFTCNARKVFLPQLIIHVRRLTINDDIVDSMDALYTWQAQEARILVYCKTDIDLRSLNSEQRTIA